MRLVRVENTAFTRFYNGKLREGGNASKINLYRASFGKYQIGEPTDPKICEYPI